MRAWFKNFAGARSTTIPDSNTTIALPPDRRFPAAQRLNYDVLSIIFTLTSTNWNGALLSLSSVCRLWRYTALSMPQMWSRIELGPSNSPSNLRMILERSKPLSLHIVIPSSAGKKQLKVLAAATDRIVCMRIIDRYRFLRNQFPILERLKLEHRESTNGDGLQYLSHTRRFPKLREFSVQIVPPSERYEMVALRPRFVGLQKLEISCWLPPHWLEIIQGVSSTVISLVLRIRKGANPPIHQLSFPRLRHLRITKAIDRPHLTFDLDAPHLECIEYVPVGYSWTTWDGILIRLRNPKSVKQLRVLARDLDTGPYPALQKLWIVSNPPLNDTMLQSLGRRIASWPELETISFYDQDRAAANVLPRIVDVIRKSGRDIDVREFLLDELDLPGDMRRNKECLQSQCHE